MTNNTKPISMDASNKVINDRISKLRKQMTSTDNEIQEIIVLGVTHAMGIGNGDVTWAGRLVNAIPKTYRRSLVKNYLDNNTMIRFTAAKERGEFKSSVKDDKALVEINKKRAESNLPALSWEQTKAYVSDKYPANYGEKEGEDKALAGQFMSPFYREPEVEREPDLFTADVATKRLEAVIAQINRQVKDPIKNEKAVTEPLDIPALRGLEAALRKVASDFRQGKIKGINDDNKLVDVAPMTRSTPASGQNAENNDGNVTANNTEGAVTRKVA